MFVTCETSSTSSGRISAPRGIAATATRIAAFSPLLFWPGVVGRMNPGSLSDWPLTEQRPLFSLMGDTDAAIGVRLMPSLLMAPTKSVSGIVFPTESTFASCQLCPRDECPNRRAPYDEGLWRRKYESVNG